ncbi:MAG: hypothetical protein K5750_10545 [Eubacterium sp.]|nr:hypothetical protein [Eubacterium sp.]
MKKSVLAIMTCALVVVLAGCGKENTDGTASSGENGSEQIVETNITEEQDISETQEPSSEVSELNENTEDISKDKAINVVWSNAYFWAMGSDYVYVDSDGKIYEEHEMEEPEWRASGACKETYSGKQLTEEEFNELLSMNIDDEDRQKELLRKKSIKFGE